MATKSNHAETVLTSQTSMFEPKLAETTTTLAARDASLSSANAHTTALTMELTDQNEELQVQRAKLSSSGSSPGNVPAAKDPVKRNGEGRKTDQSTASARSSTGYDIDTKAALAGGETRGTGEGTHPLDMIRAESRHAVSAHTVQETIRLVLQQNRVVETELREFATELELRINTLLTTPYTEVLRRWDLEQRLVQTLLGEKAGPLESAVAIGPQKGKEIKGTELEGKKGGDKDDGDGGRDAEKRKKGRAGEEKEDKREEKGEERKLKRAKKRGKKAAGLLGLRRKQGKKCAC